MLKLELVGYILVRTRCEPSTSFSLLIKSYIPLIQKINHALKEALK